MDARLRTVYRTIEDALRELAPETLREAIGQCGEADAPYAADPEDETPPAFEEDAPLRRMLGRLGLLRRSRSAANLYKLLGRMAKATGRRAEVIRKVLALYSAPADGVPHVVCGEQPRCDECPLKEDCKFYQRTPSITDLPLEQRPRERLLAEGAETLSDAELLAIILRSGTERDTAVGLAQKLLAKFGSFRGLGASTPAELGSFKGVGQAKVAQIKAAMEIGRRVAQEQAKPPGQALTYSAAVYEMYAPRLRDCKTETFLALLLDAKNRVFREVPVSKGSLTASIVHPREVFNAAVRHQAAAIICVHNHPSGDPQPSRHDITITRRLVETGHLIGIHLLDHVIIGDGIHYSFADEGRIPARSRDDG